MMGTRILTALVIGSAAISALAGPARAGSITVENDTAIVAYSGTTPAPYYGGSNPYVGTSAIGGDFTTSSLTVRAAQGPGGAVDLTFQYVSEFSGSDVVNGQQVSGADIFLAPGGGAFTYGISLGEQAQNGGVAAGFYQVTASQTSQQIWGGRSGFTYGGGVAPNTQYQPGQPGFIVTAAPTVITAGRYLSGATVSTLATGQGWYDWNVNIQVTEQQAAMFEQGFDVFWGTGDCANGAFLSDISLLSIPEPSSMVIFMFGAVVLLVGCRLAERDRREAPATGVVTR